jgi:hypothetical protein
MPYFKCDDFQGKYFDLVVLLAAFGAIILIWYVAALMSGCGKKSTKDEEEFGNRSQWWRGNGDTGSSNLDNPHAYPDQGSACDSPWSTNAVTEALALEQVGAFKSGSPSYGDARMAEQVGPTRQTSEMYDIMDAQEMNRDQLSY